MIACLERSIFRISGLNFLINDCKLEKTDCTFISELLISYDCTFGAKQPRTVQEIDCKVERNRFIQFQF
jgi:hypothetical protein